MYSHSFDTAYNVCIYPLKIAAMDEDLYQSDDEDDGAISYRHPRAREEELVADKDDDGLGLRPTDPPNSTYNPEYSPEYGLEVGSSQSATSYYSSSSSSTSSTAAAQSTQGMVDTM